MTRPEEEDVRSRVEASFARQGLMRTLGATLGAVSPGAVEITLAPSDRVSQQDGFVHAGAVSAIADTAAGYAAFSLMSADRNVLTAEFKINLVAPAIGERVVARGRVIKPGRTLTLTQAEVHAERDGETRLVALLTATMMAVPTDEAKR